MRFKIHLQEASPEAPIAQGIPSLGGIMHFSMMGGVTQSGYKTIMIQMLNLLILNNSLRALCASYV